MISLARLHALLSRYRIILRNSVNDVCVQIMGAGKTTVIAPLLALMLGDGESLVLSVVPKALLDMSRNVRVD